MIYFLFKVSLALMLMIPMAVASELIFDALSWVRKDDHRTLDILTRCTVSHDHTCLLSMVRKLHNSRESRVHCLIQTFKRAKCLLKGHFSGLISMSGQLFTLGERRPFLAQKWRLFDHLKRFE